MLSSLQCLSSIDFISRVSSERHDNRSQSVKAHEPHENNGVQGHKNADATVTSTNLSPLNGTGATVTDNRTTAINSIKENLFLNRNDLWAICPILLYQLTAASSLERSGCIDPDWLPADLHHHHHLHEQESRTWGRHIFYFGFYILREKKTSHLIRFLFGIFVCKSEADAQKALVKIVAWNPFAILLTGARLY